MKTRIIGSILVILVVVVLFIVTNQDTQLQPDIPYQQPSQNDAALKSLSLN